MSEAEKIKRAIELFDEIGTLFPNNVSMNIHNVKFENLPKDIDWKITILANNALAAKKRNDGYMNITFFQRK